ncbi:hypothetical protein RSAG8_08913, partial [Rhizoctonia solani AG-8 WAC10335]
MPVMQPPLIPSSASSASSLAKHEELANKIAQEAQQPDRAQPVAHANEGKDIDEVTSPKHAAQDTSEQNGNTRHDWQLLCGPMLKYSRLSKDSARWHGSILIVLRAPSESAAGQPDEPSCSMDGSDSRTKPVHLFTERDRVYWRIDLETALGEEEREVHYSITLAGHREQDKIERVLPLPSYSILLTSGCPVHEKSPLHVMIGGGDQIYSDGVTEPHAPLQPWAQELSPRKRSKIPFPVELRDKVDDWYFQHHCDWFNASPFREANAQIPQINVWDDHDIIDGFGTYRDTWQRAPVFMGVAEIAWKYMSLFQQHLPPSTTTNQLTYDPSSFNPAPSHPTKYSPGTIDKASVPTSKPQHPGAQKQNDRAQDGEQSGHANHEKSHKSDGTEEEVELDPSTDRTRHRICYADTYQAMFDRFDKEVIPGKTKHLLLLLGVPIAYPRLVWAETLMTSKLMAPLRLLRKIFGIGADLFNDFDGKAELLDDLEDHWTAAVHKAERNHLVQRLQTLSYTKQVRITILSGDVHLAAIGRFFTKTKFKVPQEKDHRYIVNVISSAITNAPPPEAVGDVLSARNKLHRLDHHTAENLMDIFEEGVDGSKRRVNKTCYTARNYCVITRADPSAGPEATTAEEIGDNPAAQYVNEEKKSKSPLGKIIGKDKHDGNLPKSAAEKGEISGGTGTIAKEVKGAQVGHDASALAPATGTKAMDALNISLRLEVDPKSPEGKTKAYGFSIPRLER